MLRGLLYTSHGAPRLLLPGLVSFLLACVITLVTASIAGRARTDEQRAEALQRSGKAAQAEQIYARLVRERPTVPLVLALLDAHDIASFHDKASKAMSALKKSRRFDMPDMDDEPALPDEEIEKILAGLPPEISLIARFWHGSERQTVPEEIRTEVEEGAKREPPMPWANHVLGLEAARGEKLEEAASLFEREGLAFPERASDVDRAITILMSIDAWDRVNQRMQNPQIAAQVSSSTRYRIAVHEKQWGQAVINLPAMLRPQFTVDGMVMAGVAAFGWFFFCMRLGRVGERPLFRLPMYLIAFALGVLSVGPTLLLISWEESVLKLRETGDFVRDLIFCIFGIGLREEACKLLLFLPLLPILRKWGDKLDVLVCAALVGLGFAAEENLGYLARGSIIEGLGRFITANFFHMAMTAVVGSALDDFITDRERNAAAFTRATLMVVGLHGLYDFLLIHSEIGGSYFAMFVFVVLTRMFLEAADVARRRADRGVTPLHAFIIAVGLVTGVTFAHAYSAVGLKWGIFLVGSGLLGIAIIVYVFIKTLRTI